jgi:hypothetical protein
MDIRSCCCRDPNALTVLATIKKVEQTRLPRPVNLVFAGSMWEPQSYNATMTINYREGNACGSPKDYFYSLSFELCYHLSQGCGIIQKETCKNQKPPSDPVIAPTQ